MYHHRKNFFSSSVLTRSSAWSFTVSWTRLFLSFSIRIDWFIFKEAVTGVNLLHCVIVFLRYNRYDVHAMIVNLIKNCFPGKISNKSSSNETYRQKLLRWSYILNMFWLCESTGNYKRLLKNCAPTSVSINLGFVCPLHWANASIICWTFFLTKFTTKFDEVNDY